MSRVQVMGCPVDCIDLDAAVDRIGSWMDAGPGAVARRQMSVSSSKLWRMREDPMLHRAVVDSDLILADGVGVLIAARTLGVRVPPRVTGIDLFHALVERCASTAHRPFLLGAEPGVADRVARELRERHPGLEVAGTHHGYFSEDETAGVVQAIRASGADILFVALGTPRAERFQLRFRDQLGVAVTMGVGGSFDVVAGRVRRAPPMFRDHGLEWAYRFAQEPRRLWRRNLVDNVSFAASVVKRRLW